MTTITANGGADRSTFLRRVLHVDACTCIAMGVLLSQDAGPLSGLTGLPAALLTWSGVALLPIGAIMFLVATRRPIPALGAWAVIAGNAAWVLASIAVLIELSPTALGYAFVAGQAIATGVLAELEYTGLRRLS